MNCNNAISQSKDKILIKIHVTPGSSQSVFPTGYNKWRNCVEIKVKSEAKDNKANNEVIEKIAKYFNILTTDVKIISGHNIREKTISINKKLKSEVCNKIEESLNGL